VVERIYAIGIMLFGLAVFGSALRRTLKRDPAHSERRGSLIAPTLLAVGCLIAGIVLWLVGSE
jgi:hypothetical protein